MKQRQSLFGRVWIGRTEMPEKKVNSMNEQNMYIRHTEEADLPRVMALYAAARVFMAEHGNPNQWGPTNWPPEALIRRDIESGKSFVCMLDGRVAGTFFYDCGEEIEPTYRQIDGAWIGGSEYGVIHRIATDVDTHGVGRFCIHWGQAKSGHLRIDTHPDNHVMQSMLTKCGFTRCGIIHVEEDDNPRYAYEWIRA